MKKENFDWFKAIAEKHTSYTTNSKGEVSVYPNWSKIKHLNIMFYTTEGAKKNELFCVTNKKERLRKRGTLKGVLERTTEQFVQISKFEIINIDYIESRLDYAFLFVSGGYVFKVSRSFKHHVKNILEF